MARPRSPTSAWPGRWTSDSGETQAGALMGTPLYVAPEQVSGHAHEAGPAADVYALGAILYACLTGRPPFQGETLVQTLDQVRTHEPMPPSRRQAGVPLDLDTICLKCLRKEPENRYASAAELANELARYQRGEPIHARPVGRIERAVKWVRRNPVVAASLAGLAGIILTAFLLVSGELLARRRRASRRGQAAPGCRRSPRPSSARARGRTLGALPLEYRRRVGRLAAPEQRRGPHRTRRCADAAPQLGMAIPPQPARRRPLRADRARQGRSFARTQSVGPTDRCGHRRQERDPLVRCGHLQARRGSPWPLDSAYMGGVQSRRQTDCQHQRRPGHSRLEFGNGPRSRPSPAEARSHETTTDTRASRTTRTAAGLPPTSRCRQA